MKSDINTIISDYIQQVKIILGDSCTKAVLYGSYARGDYTVDSDIDIVLFTSKKTNEFYLLIDKIAELTFETNVKYDILISPVFQNENDYNRLLTALPYFQSIQREGVPVG